MLNAAVISASVSALKIAPHLEQEYGITGPKLMRLVMDELAGCGVPDAKGIFETKQCDAPGSASLFSALENSGPAAQR